MVNEKRLIDASKLLNKYNLDCKTAQEMYIALVEAPAVDAVEVVRCKACVHSFVRYGENETYCGHPDGLNDRLRPDDFCSYGERREGE